MILIDARAAARPELGGVERWARELSARLPRTHPDAYAVACPPRALSHRAGHAWEQLALPALARARRADLVLCPANLAPLAGVRTATVVHDAAALHHGDWYSPLYVRFQRAVLPRIVARAQPLITVSAFSRDELVTYAGADPAKIRIVPGGVDHTRMHPAADAEAARDAHGLGDRPYVITVASRTARKNLVALGPAAAALAQHGIDLFAAGGGRPQFADADGLPGGVRSLGHVDEAHLPGLYAGAAAFVLPSRHEGFGLPCLEAMACGTPVVATTAGALPDTCGDAALYADPDDHAALAAQLDRLVTDEALHADLAARGLARAGEFSWERTVHEVDAALRPA